MPDVLQNIVPGEIAHSDVMVDSNLFLGHREVASIVEGVWKGVLSKIKDGGTLREKQVMTLEAHLR